MRAFGLCLLLTLGTFAHARAQLGTFDTIRADGLVAHLHHPPSASAKSSRFPAVILVGGSGGGIGWQDYMGNLLAERGFVTLAVAYFGMEGLPKELNQIPLEYFDRAIRFLRAQPSVDKKHIGIAGVSKGGELALLLASMHPDLKAVGVFVPSGVVFQSIATGFPNTSSWTLGGRDLPFIPYGSVPAGATLGDRYVAGVAQSNPALLDAATIKVEKIHGPILMLSAKSDNLFASSTLASIAEKRLHEKHFKYDVEHIAYENAGHLISTIRSDSAVLQRGGTAEGNAFAQRDGQRRFLEFFSRTLKK